MYKDSTQAMTAGSPSNCVGGMSTGKGPEREPVATEILRAAEGLHKRACSLNDRMANKLSPITRDLGPAEDNAPGCAERCIPPFFEQLRQNFRMIEIYLNGMEDTLDRVEL